MSGRGFVPTPTLACTFLPWGSGGGVNGSNASALNGSALSTPATFEAAGALRCAAPAADAGDYFTLLNDAFMDWPLLIDIPRGVVVERPIVVTHHAAGDGGAAFPRPVSYTHLTLPTKA